MKILAFAASLRKDSFNRKVIRQAAEILKNAPTTQVDLADYREFEMPIYDGDLEDRSGIPAGGQEFVRRLQAADAVVISTPEYNGSIPGTLKNAIDWASRNEPHPFSKKPILLLAASPGGLGGVRSLWQTRIPLEVLGAYVYPEMFGVAKAHEAFDDQGKFKDAKNFSRLEKLLKEFLVFADAKAANAPAARNATL